MITAAISFLFEETNFFIELKAYKYVFEKLKIKTGYFVKQIVSINNNYSQLS